MPARKRRFIGIGVVAFMVLAYGLFGVLACLALVDQHRLDRGACRSPARR
ncbi:MAG: hypothetical protein IPG56_04990 [Caulobacteraceae bacterium]|nr:hypothetical protein [Caulobacteraceae bacterium]